MNNEMRQHWCCEASMMLPELTEQGRATAPPGTDSDHLRLVNYTQ